jgi:NAD(P)-dependent dehydrogenase (short-subunit alcohol dehydrogenase family)
VSNVVMEGLNVVVTGGAGALGTAVIAHLVEAGATCHLPVRGSAGQGLPSSPRVVMTGGVDLADEDSVVRFYASLPPIAASIHLAGGFKGGSVLDTRRAELMEMVEINTVTCFLCCREAIRKMRGTGGGAIVNVTARSSIEPRRGAGMAAYAASKAAVASLTSALAEEVLKDRISINAIAPSILDTPANRAGMPKADHARWVPLDAAAELVLYLASPGTRSTSGAVIPIFGQS